MKIGIIGAGQIGGTLARRLTALAARWQMSVVGTKRTLRRGAVMSAFDPERTSARLERDFEGARKTFWTEHESSAAKLAPERTLY